VARLPLTKATWPQFIGIITAGITIAGIAIAGIAITVIAGAAVGAACTAAGGSRAGNRPLIRRADRLGAAFSFSTHFNAPAIAAPV
jgi:hypothetical protein